MSNPKEPSRPSSAPAYAINPLERQDSETLRELAEYCHNLAEYKEHKSIEEIVEREDVPDEVQERLQEPGPTIVEQKRKCNKDSCSTCPHGPYKYKYWREGDKIKSEYIGVA